MGRKERGLASKRSWKEEMDEGKDEGTHLSLMFGLAPRARRMNTLSFPPSFFTEK
jgi:hypothetical protein